MRAVVETGLELTIRPDCLAKMMAYARANSDAEISGLGTIQQEGTMLIIDDVFIADQRVSAAAAEIEADALADFLTTFVTAGGDISALRVWWHSHGPMPAFHSATDLETIKSAFAHLPWMVSLVINCAGQINARLIITAPFPLMLIDLPVQLYLPEATRLSIWEEIGRLVKRLPPPVTLNPLQRIFPRSSSKGVKL